MRRRVVLVAVWVLGTIASVALAWAAVSAVGGEVTGSPGGDGALSAAEVADIVTSSTTIGGTGTTSTTAGAPATPTTTVPASTTTTRVAPSPTPTTTATTAPPPAAQRRSDVFDAAGGTVGASCTGAAISLDFATPRAGYSAELHETGPEKLDVRFEADGEGESKVVVRCVDGAPTASVEEERDD